MSDLFERFNDNARRVIVTAQAEAMALNHHYLGTEHILLALLRDSDGVAAKVLESLGADLLVIRRQVEDAVGRGQQIPRGHIPLTARAKSVIELSMREALQVGHNYVGTEHLLLGLIREGEGVASQVLASAGVDTRRVRQEIIEALAGHEEREPDRVDGTAAWDAEEVVARLAGIEAALRELTETVEALRRRLDEG